MTVYIAQWTRKGDGLYDPVNYAKVEGSSKRDALKKASKAISEYSTIDVMMIMSMKEYGITMSDRLALIG